MARPDKVSAVEDITSRFGESNAALLTEYRGLTVTEIAEVRGALREADADYKVLKNTLVRIAAQNVGLEELVPILTGPTAIAFCRGDAVAAAKALDDAAKRFPVLVVKGGVLKGKILDADQARELARIESREVLLSKVAMLVKQPAQQTVNVLSALLRNFGSMLAQVVEKKASGELPGGAEVPAASEPPPEPAPQAAPEEAPEADEPPAELPEAIDQAAAAPEADVREATEDTGSAPGGAEGNGDSAPGGADAPQTDENPEASAQEEE
ncbi:MAG: 50S ribosomal protein L10 [Actinomycetota bacterium]|nr:50S ribosomal protein L10 [Actinomycetota bacterium]